MKKSLVFSSSIAAAFLFAVTVPSTVLAHGDYLTDSDGNPVRDGFGECISIGGIKHNDGKDCGKAPKKVVAKPKPKPAPPAPKPVVHENITLGASALFGHDKSSLRPAGAAELDTLATKLNSYYSLDSINVTGHTDSQGAEAYNQGLSERRAATVKDYLVSKGISSSKISTSGSGENTPVAPNDTAEGRQQNRRVEIMIKARR